MNHFKEFADQEIDILNRKMTTHLSKLDSDPEGFDPDYIGSEKQAYKNIIGNLARVSDILEMLPEDISRSDGIYISKTLNNIFKGIPLSSLRSYEHNPEEWTVYKNCWCNNRHPTLIRRSIKINNGKDTKIVYSDVARFKLYDVINAKETSIRNISFGIEGIPIQIITMLDQMFPIEFPYNFPEDIIKIGVRAFECTLQDGAEPVRSLCLDFYKSKSLGVRTIAINKYYDISEDGLKEIDLKTFSTRRQIFEKAAEKEENKDENT